ncbi:NAD(P)-dependent oxidoreductase, partial [Staphylococcus warneri]|uniref:NAD(P)-dependent oxidoreductase n=1 Tax=Staphylococcus warneri TaxID=1292 RepID=UPI003703900E
QSKTSPPYLLSPKHLYPSTLPIFPIPHIPKPFPKPLKPFHSNLLYHNPSTHQHPHPHYNPTFLFFQQLLYKSDFLLSTAPLTHETKY